MIRQGHIGRSQAVLLLWYAVAAKVFLTFPTTVMAEGRSGSWLILLNAGLLALVAFIPGVVLMRRFDPFPLARAADTAGGLIVGKLFSFTVTAYLTAVVAMVLRSFAESFLISILPQTPLLVIMATFAFLIAYSAYQGLETLGRMVLFITPWALGFFGVVVLGGLRDFSILRLFPLFGPGVLEIAWHSIHRTSAYGEIIILLILYPYLRERKDALPIGAGTLILSLFIFTLIQVVLTCVFETVGTHRFVFGILQLARLSNLGRFVTRIDPLYVALWFLVAGMKLAVTLWAACTQLAEALRLPSYRPLVAPVVVVATAAGFLPPGLDSVASLSDHLWEFGGLFAFGAPAILLVIALIRKKRAPRAETGAGAEKEAAG